MSLTRADNQSPHEPGRPETALDFNMVKPGDRILTYEPGRSGTTQRYEILPTPKGDEHLTEDSRGDLLLWVRNRDTGVESQIDSATLGLTCSADGARYRWAIPDDTDDN